MKILKRKFPVFSIIIIIALSIISITLIMPGILFAQDEEASEEEAPAEPEPEELLFETTLPKIQAKEGEAFTFNFYVTYMPGDEPFGLDEDTKTKAEDILKNFNLRISDAINIFLRQVVLEEGIPFEVKLPQYEKAYKELEKAVAYNAFGGGIPSDYANNILKLYAKNLIDLDTAVFALSRKIR